MNRHWWIVLHKELRDALRDRRSLRSLAVMIVLYPALMWVALNNGMNRQEQGNSSDIRVAVANAAQAPQLLAQLREAGLKPEAIAVADEKAAPSLLQQQRFAAVIQLGEDFAARYAAREPAALALWHDSVGGKPAQLEKVTAALQAYSRDATAARLTSQGVSLAHLSPLRINRYDIATPQTRAGRHIAVLFGIFLIGVFYFGMDLVIDSSAGERERRSLEILLAQPVRGLDLIVGKWLAAAVFCATGLALEFVVGHVMLQSLPLENLGLSWQVGAADLAAFYLLALPLCLLAPALQLAVALNSRSFKEAQSSMVLVIVVALVPAFIPTLELEKQDWWYRVPLLAEQTLLQDLARSGSMELSHALTAMGIALAGAFACIAFAARRLGSERYVVNV